MAAHHPDLWDLRLDLLKVAPADPGRWGRHRTTHRQTSSPSFAAYSSQERMEAWAFARCFQVSTWGVPTTSTSRFALAVMPPANRTKLDPLLTWGKYFFPRRRLRR